MSEEKFEEYWKVIRGRERDCKVTGGNTFPLRLTFSQAFDMAVALDSVACPGSKHAFEFRLAEDKWMLRVQGSGVADITCKTKEEALAEFIQSLREIIDKVIERKTSEANKLYDEAEVLEEKLKEAVRGCLVFQEGE